MKGDRVERSPEFELVLGCARSIIQPGAAAPLTVPPGVDWGRVQALALGHGLLPPVRRHLTDLGALPASAQDGFARLHAGIVARSARLVQELGLVVAALDAAGVECLVYKGPALAAQVFGDPRARAFQDLDLLVRPGDLAQARRVLFAAGYRRLHPDTARTPQPVLSRSECDESFIHTQREVPIELHWSVVPPYFSVPLTTDSLFEGRVRVAIGERQVWAPGVPDLLLLLALNSAKDGWCRLEPIFCLAELVRREPGLPWPALRARAEALRLARVWQVALLLAHRLLGAPLPGDVLQPAASDPAAARLADQIIARLHRGETLPPGVLQRWRLILRSRERLRDRVRFCLLRALTPTRKDAAAVPLPEALWPAYYLLRPVRLLASMALRRAGGPR